MRDLNAQVGDLMIKGVCAERGDGCNPFVPEMRYTGNPPNCIASSFKTSKCITEPTLYCTVVKSNVP